VHGRLVLRVGHKTNLNGERRVLRGKTGRLKIEMARLINVDHVARVVMTRFVLMCEYLLTTIFVH